MNNFNIVNLNEENNKVLIVMKTSESPFDFVSEFQEKLMEIQFSGIVVIDELLHSGNTEERFISGFFDGHSFDNSKFRFESIARKSMIRNYICEYLKSDKELMMYSGLTTIQQRLISKGCVI
mgnify:FL=1